MCSSSNRILRFDDAVLKANGADADGVLGQPVFTSSTVATTQSGMDSPRGVALIGGSLFVSDRNNHRVLRFDDAAIKTDGANADGVLGQPDFTSSAITITQTSIEYPSRLAADESGRLYVSDGFNADRVLVFVYAVDKANGAPADYVLGQPDFASQGAATAQNRLDMDSTGGGLAVDSTGNHLFVADDNNNRVMDFAAVAEVRNAILDVDKSGPGAVSVGGPITYTLTVTNSGPVTATQVVITDVLPVGASYVGGGTLMPGGVVSWTLPSLAGGGSTVQVQFVVTATQTITNDTYGAAYAGDDVPVMGEQIVVTTNIRRLYMPSIFRNHYLP